MYRVAINGYGRIGQSVLRALYENHYREHLQVVAINELSDIDTIAYLTRYDTTHGRFGRPVSTTAEALVVDGDVIQVSRQAEPGKLPWKALDIDLVLECTGVFSQRVHAQAHIDAGAKRVLFSQPAAPDVDKTIVYGVNETLLVASDRIVSNASCTTNCVVPVIKLLHEAFGVEWGTTTTIHSAMNDQPVIDAYHHHDLRRTRSAMNNLVPVDTELGRGIGRILPAMQDKFTAMAVRVPTLNVSAIDLTVQLTKPVDCLLVNNLFRAASENGLKGVLGYTEEPLASSDFNHDSRSGIVDGSQTRVSGQNLLKVFTWFDNEWGFANRMLDVSRHWLGVNK
ncbi:MAG: type I glyceraldehyde-3-phosphate dehydrogenase [Hahellaceae bacterium]|nr:type I glyceraldehyde-3-phosphate dehydrogenase [Hahellaceae bacterium]MCP5211098.1 type I glyceraldehyde-3-phosphate dehydrogenase [Hahellaceae bacterium]